MAIQAYMLVYNMSQAMGWSAVLGATLRSISNNAALGVAGSLASIYAEAGWYVRESPAERMRFTQLVESCVSQPFTL